jgi:hypothetical protein
MPSQVIANLLKSKGLRVPKPLIPTGAPIEKPLQAAFHFPKVKSPGLGGRVSGIRVPKTGLRKFKRPRI